MSGRRYIRVGLTGGIGSGKSTASDRLRELGALVLDADGVSRRALEPGGACYERTVRLFGKEILRSDGSIDRKAVAARAFSDEKLLKGLNAIVHPYVIQTLLETADRALGETAGAVAVFDVPLLFESGMHREMDHTVLVTCGEETRLRRIMERDGCTEAAAHARIRSQMPEEEKRLLADEILDNDGSREDLLRQVDRFYRRLIDTKK